MCTLCFTSVMFALNFATSPGVWVHFPIFLPCFVFASEIFDYLIVFLQNVAVILLYLIDEAISPVRSRTFF